VGYDQKCLHVSTRYFCPILVRAEFSQTFFEKYLNIKFHENPFSRSRDARCGRKVGQTDRMKLIVTFRNFARVPKIRQLKYKTYYTLIMKYIGTKTLSIITVVPEF